MSITQQQTNAIQADGEVIVSASAGSGKTFVMIERLVRLVKEHKSVENILAVTFTNKAAAQMKDRARKAIAEAYRAAQGEERKWLKSQLDALPLADICTIHSFCGRLVRTYFYIVGVDPRFRIVAAESAEGNALSARAVETVLDAAYQEGGEWFGMLLSSYFRKKKDDTLRKIIVKLYDKARNSSDYRDRLQRCADGGDAEWDLGGFSAPEDLFKAEISADSPAGKAREELKEIFAYFLENFQDRAGHVLQKIDDLAPYVAEFAPRGLKQIEHLRTVANKIAGETDFCALCAWGQSAALERTTSKSKKDSPESAYVVAQISAVTAELRDVVKEIKAMLQNWREEFSRFLGSRKYSVALARLILLYDEAFMKLKREAGVLDYGDLEHLALAILENEDAQKDVKTRYRYIFVDEYQDVNPMQDKILGHFQGADIFLVGDKKQAIYAFRGSRSKFFDEKMKELKKPDAVRGQVLSLDRNFRSGVGVLDAVNRVFCAAMRGENYSPMEGGDRYGDYRGEVFLHAPAEEVAPEVRERGVYSVLDAGKKTEKNGVARRVLSIIFDECGRKEGLGKEWFDVDANQKKGAPRKVRYGDIAVLVRINDGEAGSIVRLLSEYGIPVTASSGVNVCEFFEARLLIDWLSFLDNPEQDIPLATALLSAIGGFTDRDLALIRLNTKRPAHGVEKPFREACSEYISAHEGKNDLLSEKLKLFFARVKRLRALSRVRTAGEMLSLLLAEGLEAQIAAKGDSKNRLARVRRLVAEGKDCGSIHEFLRRLKDADFEVEFAESGGEGAVNIVTMHKSKGLEYPVVILTELERSIKPKSRDEVLWTERFGLAPYGFDHASKFYFNTLVRQAAELAVSREEIESERNLLYVAMTRAKYRLHIITALGAAEVPPAGLENLDGAFSPYKAQKLSDFFPMGRLGEYIVEEEGGTVSPPEKHSFTVEPDPAVVDEILAAAKSYTFSKSVSLPVKSSATDLLHRGAPLVRHDYDRSEEVAQKSEGYSPDTGTAYHAFLERVNFGEPAGEELARMKREGLLPEEMFALLDEARLESILAIPFLASLKGKPTFREHKFLARFPAREFFDTDEGDDSEIIFQGAVDLIVPVENGYRIVDYKFSALDDDALRQKYAVQLKLYRKTVAAAMRVEESAVSVAIINIAKGREILP